MLIGLTRRITHKQLPVKRTKFQTHRRTMSTSTKKIGTHSGNFHCDEALACYMLTQLDDWKDATIVRSRDTEVLKTCDILVDVGGVYDPTRYTCPYSRIIYTM